MPPIESALVKAGVSLAGVAILGLRIYRSGKPPQWFGVARPRVAATIAFIAAYLAWMLASNALIDWRGPWDFRPWQQAPLLASALRVLAVCVLGPMVEELLFRGILFSWLKERLPIGPVIALTSVGWALLHWSYAWPVIAVIAVDGVLLGVARWRTRSVVPPIAMHMLYNLYAIW